MSETEKPRLAEILGVEVGEKFYIRGHGAVRHGPFAVTRDGYFKTEPPNQPGASYHIFDAIEHPERVVREAPRLTDNELSVCFALKARYVSRDLDGDASVDFWSGKPEYNDAEGVYFTPGGGKDLFIAVLAGDACALFRNLRPGECAEIAECVESPW